MKQDWPLHCGIFNVFQPESVIKRSLFYFLKREVPLFSHLFPVSDIVFAFAKASKGFLTPYVFFPRPVLSQKLYASTHNQGSRPMQTLLNASKLLYLSLPRVRGDVLVSPNHQPYS